MEKYIDYFGYTASVVVLISLTMRSIVKLRWINLLGAILFSSFGFMIHSMPTGFLNLAIALIDLYYIWKIYRKKEEIVLIEVEKDSKYLEYIYEKNKEEIKEFFPEFQASGEMKTYYMLRDNTVAGVMVFSEKKSGLISIELDYVFVKYRDYKLGEYLFIKRKDILKDMGYVMIHAKASNDKHREYLKRLGFENYEDGEFVKRL